MSIAHSLNFGRTLYVDAWDHHTFLDIIIFQHVFKLFGTQIGVGVIHLGNIVLVAFMLLSIFYIIYSLTKNFFASGIGLCVASFLFAATHFRSSYGEFYHSATFLLSLICFCRIRSICNTSCESRPQKQPGRAFFNRFAFIPARYRIVGFSIIAGASMAIGFFIKQTAVFDICAISFAAFFFRRHFRNARVICSGVVIGATSIALVSTLYFLLYGSLSEALYASFVDPYYYATGENMPATLQKFASTLLMLMSYLATMHWLLSVFFAVLFWFIPYSLLRELTWERMFLFLWVCCVVGGIVCIGRFYAHYAIQLIAPLSIVIAIAISAIKHSLTQRIICLAAFAFLYFPPILYADRTDSVHALDYTEDEIAAVAAHVRRSTSGKDRIFLYQSAALCLYFLCERFPPTKVFMDHQLLPENRDARFLLPEALHKLYSEPPQLIIMGSLKRSIPEIEKLIVESYTLETNIGAHLIFRRKG